LCRVLLDCNANIEAHDFTGRTPLYCANDIGTCRLLLQYKADVAAKTTISELPRIPPYEARFPLPWSPPFDDADVTPLHSFACAGRPEICQLLLQAGADVLATTSTQQMTALHYSVGHRSAGCVETCRLLVQSNADVLARTSDGSTAFAISAGYLEEITFTGNAMQSHNRGFKDVASFLGSIVSKS
jgi:hypothetical protein